MAWTTPTLREVRARTRDDIAAHLPGADATVPNSVLRVLADSNAGLAYLNLLYLDWLARQFLPDTAETEWLDRHGAIWLGGRKAATYAKGTVLLTGIAGTTVPLGTTVQSADAIIYQTTEVVIIGASATSVAVEALTPGSVGNREQDATLSLPIALAGVNGSAVVETISGGVDEESDDDLRTRVLLRIRRPPMGGAADDYVQWALSIPGVTRAWVYPNEMGIGTVTVRIMCDELRANAGGFPNADDLGRVRAYLDTVRPVAIKDFWVSGPIPQPLSMTVRNLSRDTPSTRAAIEKAVRDMLYERAAPGQTIFASWVAEAISGALGEDHHDLEFANAVMPSNGHMGVLTNIFYA
ncbi:baseplate J/gp47 family protein [Methylobacterium oryzisoli]|uniref:baseplate J/gp47 family protein n=1 Tax=Methylobacterium oryzisoli TaxID=3385502 RepID=UPI00389201D6